MGQSTNSVQPLFWILGLSSYWLIWTHLRGWGLYSMPNSINMVHQSSANVCESVAPYCHLWMKNIVTYEWRTVGDCSGRNCVCRRGPRTKFAACTRGQGTDGENAVWGEQRRRYFAVWQERTSRLEMPAWQPHGADHVAGWSSQSVQHAGDVSPLKPLDECVWTRGSALRSRIVRQAYLGRLLPASRSWPI
jgi:hypothetical protein